MARLGIVFVVPLWVCGCSGLFGEKLADSTSKKKEQEKASQPAEKATPAPAARINSGTHIAAGQMLERQGDFNGAAEQYEKAVTTDPRQVMGYNRLGIVYQKMGRVADADLIFRQGLSAAPGSAMLHNNLGYNFLQQKKFVEAETSFRDSLSLQPDFKRARMNLAITLAHQSKYSTGVEEFSKVVPGDVAHFNVAAVCMQKGDYLQCETSLKQALSINPNCPGARDQLQKVSRLAASQPRNARPAPVQPLSPLAGDSSQEPSSP